MTQIALHTRLKPDAVDAYVELHRRIPEDLVGPLHAAGVAEWRIWRDGTELFHLVDVADYRSMRATLAVDPANLRWQARVGPLHDLADDYRGLDDGLSVVWSLTGQLAT